MNIGHEGRKVTVVRHAFAVKGALEQRTGAGVCLVEGLGICDKQIVELAAGVQDLQFRTSLQLFVLGTYQEVKVVL